MKLYYALLVLILVCCRIRLATTVAAPTVPFYTNRDLENLVMPIRINVFRDMLIRSNYDGAETQFLIEGFSRGFDIGYQGPVLRQDVSRNLPFTVGNKFVLWEKIMKEVQLKRYAGPYDKVPFQNYIQSPIGLVPKAGNKTRLIFHLSYRFPNGNESVNYWTPHEC